MRHEQAVLSIASHSGGVVSTKALIDAGLPPHITKLGRAQKWQQLLQGIWLPSEEPPTFAQWMWAAKLAYGNDCAAGGAAALHIHGIHDQEPDVIDIWLREDRHLRTQPDSPLRLRRDKVKRLDRMPDDAWAVLPGDALADYLDQSRNLHAVSAMIINTRFKLPEFLPHIRSILKDRKRLRHRQLSKLLLTCEPAFDSILEFGWITQVEIPHKIPASQRQWVCPSGFKRDNYWEAFFQILELDGDRFHSDKSTIQTDRRKNRLAMTQGLNTIRFGYADVFSTPCASALELKRIVPNMPVQPCNEWCALNANPKTRWSTRNPKFAQVTFQQLKAHLRAGGTTFI